MKSKKKLYSIVLASIALIFFSLISISSTSLAASTQRVDGQLILTETQITTNESDQWGPAIYSDKIVWYDNRNGNNYDLYMYNLSAHNETQITTSGSLTYFPAIYGDIIVWDEYRNGNHCICMYNTSTCTETQVTADISLHNNLDIYEDKIVWDSSRNGNNDIYMYNLSTDTETQITTNESNQQNSAICGDIIVWDDWRNGNRDIYMYDLSTHEETQITTNELDQSLPEIYNDRIVWQDYGNGNLNMYNVSSSKEIQITAESQPYSPDIYGDRIIWSDWYNVYMYNLSTSKEIQINLNESRSEKSTPAIYGDRIVWQDWRNGNYDIYMCTVLEEEQGQRPVVNFSTNVTDGYAPLSVQFTDLSEYATEWDWDFGDGVASTDQNPTHTYSAAGTYTVSLTVSNANGSTSKLSTINVLQPSVYAYITNMGSNNVSVIDTSTNTVTATVNVGHYPLGVAVNPDGTKVYVANADGTVSIIDTSANNVIGTVEVGKYPYGIAVNPDGTKVYVANYGNNNVSVIDTTTNTVTATVNVGEVPVGVAVTPDGTKIYVTNHYSNTVSVIDTATNKVTGTVNVGKFPIGIAVSPDGKKVYVTSVYQYGSDLSSLSYGSDFSSLSVINATTNNVTATVNLSCPPAGIVVNPTGTKVYVANYGSYPGYEGTVSVIDTARNEVTATVNAGNRPYGVAVTPDGTKLYVANQGSNNVSVIDTATNNVIGAVNVGNSPIAFGQFIGGKSVIPVSNLSTNVTQVIPELTEADNGKSINLRNGEIFYLILPENPGTPYSLQLKLSNGLTILSKKSIPRNPPLKIEIPGRTMGVVHIWKIKVNSESDQKIKGTYERFLTGEIARTYTFYLKIGNEDNDDNDGGGRGGAGGSPESAKNIEVKELSQVFITNGNAIKFDFTKNATCVMYVSFDSKKTVGKTTTVVEMLKNRSTLAPDAPGGEVYNFLNIWVGNSGYATEKNIENATVCFKVEKSWIRDKNIDQSSIILNRYNDQKWDQLPTILLREADKYLYFAAQTPGFSPFAITGKTTTKETGTEIKPEIDTQGVEENSTEPNIEQEPETEESTGMPGFGIIYCVVCLLGVFLCRRR